MKEVAAFANCEGGKIYIGVKDDGTVVGLDDPDSKTLQVRRRDGRKGFAFAAGAWQKC